MLKERVADYIQSSNSTMFGVGPMSVNCVDAAIEICNIYDFPLFLIASRRQIDSKKMGGGYVNNWSTEDFAKYVKAKDMKKNVILARDHGGPWQNDKEIADNLSFKNAMASAKESYRCDIESGFTKIHIDPSIDIHQKLTVDETLNRIFELYSYCWDVAQEKKKDIIFEIGTEEQSGTSHDLKELEYIICKVQEFTTKESIISPSFVVVQTGTRVMETQNVGVLNTIEEIPQDIPKAIELCKKYNVFLKQHNTDYLSTEILKKHPEIGIHSANIAPEFGVAETMALVNLLEEHKLKNELNHFIKISLESKKWDKWMLPKTEATDREKAIIAGHYIFSHPEFITLKEKITTELSKLHINLNQELKFAVKESIFRYVSAFGLVKK